MHLVLNGQPSHQSQNVRWIRSEDAMSCNFVASAATNNGSRTEWSPIRSVII